jgi:hypothetical protein
MINYSIDRTPVINKRQYANLIYKHIKNPLSSVPFHQDVEGLQRYVADGFPYHLAIHQFVRMYRPPAAYTQPHVHPFDELNIIIGDDLEYNIMLGDESYVIKGHHSIWIPAGVTHAANVISGTGYYVAIRLDNQ